MVKRKPSLRAGFLVTVAAMASVVACEQESTREPEASYVSWWSRVGPHVGRPISTAGSYASNSELRLPRVAAAGADVNVRELRSPTRFIVNLLTDERGIDGILVKGRLFRESDPESIASLRTYLDEFTRTSRPKETWRSVLRAGDGRSWSRVAALMDIVRTAVPLESVEFAVDIGVPTVEGHIDAVLHALKGESTSEATPVALDVVEGSGAVAPRVRIGDRSWTFLAGDPYRLGAPLDAANAHWEAIYAELRHPADSPSVPLRLTIDGRVPWAHVAQFFGLATFAGRVDVELPVNGYAMRLSTPHAVSPDDGHWIPARPRPLGERDPRDWSPEFGIAVGVVAAGLLVWFSSRRGKPRRRAPRAGQEPRA
jgi:hypothetical protein